MSVRRLPKRITVSEYAARWMATYDAAPSSTRDWYRGNLDRYILPAIGRRSMAGVTDRCRQDAQRRP